jgi:hypothetical protein
MATLLQGTDARLIVMGRQVTSKITALPQTATASLFTVSGGKVIVTSLVGIVTTIIQAQANAVKLVATPGAGTANDMCGTLDINAAEIGAMLSLDGVLATALQGNVAKSGSVGLMTKFQVVDTGTIGLNAAASSTGAITWKLTYVPFDDGASVVSA